MKLLPKRDSKLQYEFLPSALEIVETPASPFGRIVIWLIIALLGIAFLWAYFGEIDVIASGQGKVMPAGNVKTIQPANGGVINSIRVSEGEKVKKDQLLVELDSTLATSEVKSLEKSLVVLRLERDILKASTEGRDITELVNNADIPEDIKTDLINMAQSKASVSQIKRQLLSVGISQAQSQLDVERKNLGTLQDNLNDLQTRKRELETQISQSSGTERALLESQLQQLNEQITNAQTAVGSQSQRVAQAQGAVSEAGGNLNSFNAENSSSTLSTVVDYDKQISELENNLEKAKKDVSLMSIKSVRLPI